MAHAPDSNGFSLRRWSQRKLAAGRRDEPARPGDRAAESTAEARDDRPIAPPAGTVSERAATGPHPMGSAASRAAGADKAPLAPAAANAANAAALPPLESLTIDSDFSPFMQAGVDENLKRSALRKLLRDPRFNVMDGLDVYIDDYSKPSPLEPELARALMQARYIFDPPKTRVTPEGVVEDIPAGEDAVVALDDGAGTKVTPPGRVALHASDAAAVPTPCVPAAIAADAGAHLPGDPATLIDDAAARVAADTADDR
jgi:uncharacterized protein DUF3306